MMNPETTKKTSTPASHGKASMRVKPRPRRSARFAASCFACEAATDSAASGRRTWTRTSLDNEGDCVVNRRLLAEMRRERTRGGADRGRAERRNACLAPVIAQGRGRAARIRTVMTHVVL